MHLYHELPETQVLADVLHGICSAVHMVKVSIIGYALS